MVNFKRTEPLFLFPGKWLIEGLNDINREPTIAALTVPEKSGKSSSLQKLFPQVYRAEGKYDLDEKG